MRRSVDSADIFLQSSQTESWHLEDGLVKGGDFSIHRGFGLRVINGEKTGFAYADYIDLKMLNQAVESAQSIAHGTGNAMVKVGQFVQAKPLYPAINPIQSMVDNEKVALLYAVDKAARQADARVQQVIAQLSAQQEVILITHSDGTLAA